MEQNVLNAATETASMILRIDNVIAASNSKSAPKPGGTPGDQECLMVWAINLFSSIFNNQILYKG